MKRFIATTVLSVIAAITVGQFAFAVTNTPQGDAGTGQALEIGPPVIDLRADPGQTLKTTINIRDVSSTPLLVTGTVDDFAANGEDGTPRVLVDSKEPSPYSIRSWVAPINRLTLKPREVQSLPITINVPKNAAPGGYYGVIRFTGTPPGIEGSGVSLSASLGSLVFIRVNGDAKEKMELKNFTTSGPNGDTILFESAPITFVERIENNGNVHEQPVGRITVKDMFGNAIANVNVNLDRRNVLPGSVRKFEQTLDKTNIGDRFLFGIYNAEVVMTYGNNQTVSKTTSFWVLPWRAILALLVLLVVIVIGGRIALKRHNERLVGRSRGSRRR